MYIHHTPVGINNWNVMVSVDEPTAFAKLALIGKDLYFMAGSVAVILLLYMWFIIMKLRKVYEALHRMDIEDKLTELQNRVAYDAFCTEVKNKIFARVNCVYVDANGLHKLNNEKGHTEGDKMLQTIAGGLKLAFPPKSIYRIGGDEFVVIDEAMTEEECIDAMDRVREYIGSAHYAISVGIVSKCNVVGLEEAIKEADEIMLANKRAYYASHDRRQR